jgi:hypothetical protein
VLNEWILVFECLLKVLPDTITKEAIDLAIGLGDLSQPLASRVVSARLIGHLAQNVDSKTFKLKLLARTKALC